MNTFVKVARLHLVDKYTYTWLVWGILLFTLLVNIAVYALIPAGPDGNFTGAILTVFVFMSIAGVLAMTRVLPFAFALGVSRRTYYLGTLLLMAGLSLLDAVILTVLRRVEAATNGWGLDLNFFRVPWIFSGSWYSALLNYFVVLALSFLLGMWFGLVYARFKLIGMLALLAAIVLILLAVAAIITWSDSWAAFGRWVSGLHVMGFIGVLAALGVLIVLAGYGTIRRITA